MNEGWETEQNLIIAPLRINEILAYEDCSE